MANEYSLYTIIPSAIIKLILFQRTEKFVKSFGFVNHVLIVKEKLTMLKKFKENCNVTQVHFIGLIVQIDVTF